MGCATSTPSSGGAGNSARKARRGTTGLLRSTSRAGAAVPAAVAPPPRIASAVHVAPRQGNPLRPRSEPRSELGSAENLTLPQLPLERSAAAAAAATTGAARVIAAAAAAAAAPTPSLNGNATLDADESGQQLAGGPSDPIVPDEPLSTSLFEMDLTPSATTPSAASDATDVFERRATSRVRTASVHRRSHRRGDLSGIYTPRAVASGLRSDADVIGGPAAPLTADALVQMARGGAEPADDVADGDDVALPSLEGRAVVALWLAAIALPPYDDDDDDDDCGAGGEPESKHHLSTSNAAAAEPRPRVKDE